MGDMSYVTASADPIRVSAWLERLGGRVTDPLTGKAYDLLSDYEEQSCRVDLTTGRISCEFVPREGDGCAMVTIFLPRKNIWVHILAKEETMTECTEMARKPEVPAQRTTVEQLRMTHAEAVERRRRINGWTITSSWPDRRQSL